MEISILLEMMDMLPSNDFDEFQRYCIIKPLSKDYGKSNCRCLEDIGTFSENLLRWNSYTRYTVDLREILAIKSSNLEQRLSIIFGSLKVDYFLHDNFAMLGLLMNQKLMFLGFLFQYPNESILRLILGLPAPL